MSVYNFILVKPFTTMMDAIASLVHLKLKYHDLQGNPATINADLEGAKIIYQSLKKDQGEHTTMKINVASLTRQHNKMDTHYTISV